MSLRHQLEHQQTVGWPAQTLLLPVIWYTNIAQDSEYGFPISGDRTRLNAYPDPIGGELRFCQEVHSDFYVDCCPGWGDNLIHSTNCTRTQP